MKLTIRELERLEDVFQLAADRLGLTRDQRNLRKRVQDEMASRYEQADQDEEPTTEPAPAALSWDWRGQPDLEHLADELTRLTGGRLHLREVATGEDDYAITISTTPLDDRAALAAYRMVREG